MEEGKVEKMVVELQSPGEFVRSKTSVFTIRLTDGGDCLVVRFDWSR